MNDLEGTLFALGASGVIVGASTTYEYFKCKHLLKQNPQASYFDLLRDHNAVEYLISFLGAAGPSMAISRYGKPK